jgi:hypothetical protein
MNDPFIHTSPARLLKLQGNAQPIDILVMMRPETARQRGTLIAAPGA